MFSAIQRAFASNLQKVVVKPSERSKLEAAGIHNPSLQTYLTWRLGLMSFVVISTRVALSGVAAERNLGFVL